MYSLSWYHWINPVHTELIWSLNANLCLLHYGIEFVFFRLGIFLVITMVTWISHYSVIPIYHSRVYRGIGYIAVVCWTPFFCPPISRILQTWRPRARCLSRYRGNRSDPICGRQFFAKSAHRNSLCSRWQETIFHEINSSLPVYAGLNTCCAKVSHARWSIDTSIVS